jgi:hypothetical protein
VMAKPSPMAVVFSSRVRSGVSAASPQVPWRMTVPSVALARKWPASPAATASEPMMVVATDSPATAGRKAGSLNPRVARSVSTSAEVGRSRAGRRFLAR